MTTEELQAIKKFIGTAEADKYGGYIWGADSKGNRQMIAEVRGWGSIQNRFKTQDEAARFQDSVHEFIVVAINDKLKTINL